MAKVISIINNKGGNVSNLSKNYDKKVKNNIYLDVFNIEPEGKAKTKTLIKV